MVAVVRIALAEIGEIKAALAVEDDVVRRREFMPVALAVEGAHLAGTRVDALDIAVSVILGRSRRQKPAFGIFVSAIVADIERAVGSPREPVRSATRRPDRRVAAVRRDTGDCTAGDLAQDDRAVGHRNWPLGEPQPARHYAYVRHRAFLPWLCLTNSVAAVPCRSSDGSGLTCLTTVNRVETHALCNLQRICSKIPL